MKYGASSYIWVSPFSNDTLWQLKHAKDLGFDIYEIGVEDPSGIDIHLVKEEADKIGIDVHICGAFGKTRDISSENIEYQKTGMEYMKQLIDMAKITGSPYVAGPMYSATGKARLATKDEKQKQTEYALENMRRLGEYAEQNGVCLALEPLNRFETDFMNTVEQGLEFIEKIDCNNIGFLLDTFHMNIEEKNIGKAIVMAGDKVFDFHACANDRGTPGEDHLNWAEIKSSLKEISYQGPIVIESFTTEITEIAKAVSLWRPLAKSQDKLAKNGLKFLHHSFGTN